MPKKTIKCHVSRDSGITNARYHIPLVSRGWGVVMIQYRALLNQGMNTAGTGTS